MKKLIVATVGICIMTLCSYAFACDCTTCHGLMHNNCADWGSDTCNSCHGNPPSLNVPGQGGLVRYPSPTGSTTAGGHLILAHRYGGSDSCQKCHFGGMPIAPITSFGILHIGINASGFSGAGSSYDGQPLSSQYSYQGTNGTTVTTNGTGKCSNLYCHSDGTAVSTGVISSNSTPPWSSVTGTVETLPCNSCHGFPPSYPQDSPKANSHVIHNSYVTCDMCHYNTTNDGVHITNEDLNANGTYNLAPNPSKLFSFSGQSTVVNFAYQYDVGGGTCSNISCHQIAGNATTRIWGGVQPTASGAACSNTNVAYGQESCTVSSVYGGTPPYTFLWQFADGSTGTTQTVTHTFQSGEALNVSVTIRDANKHASTINASVATPVISTSQCPMGVSSPPILNDTISLSGTTFPVTVTVTDNSVVCNAYHTGSAAYQQYLIVSWGDGSSATIDYTIGDGTPITQTFSHTYNGPKSSGGHYSICVIVRDKYGSISQQCYDAGI